MDLHPPPNSEILTSLSHPNNIIPSKLAFNSLTEVNSTKFKIAEFHLPPIFMSCDLLKHPSKKKNYRFPFSWIFHRENDRQIIAITADPVSWGLPKEMPFMAPSGATRLSRGILGNQTTSDGKDHLYIQ
jgi:hypothetical protein